jgi:pimeloyl-ACP methyl ester carboxylesterase
MSWRREERMVTIALPKGGGAAGPQRGELAPGGSLEGIFITGATRSTRGAVVAPPHPLFGGSLESPVLNEIVYACRQGGIAPCASNWRGVGASAGSRAETPRMLTPTTESRLDQMAADYGDDRRLRLLLWCGSGCARRPGRAPRGSADPGRAAARDAPRWLERLARPVLVLVGERDSRETGPVARASAAARRRQGRGGPDGGPLSGGARGLEPPRRCVARSVVGA